MTGCRDTRDRLNGPSVAIAAVDALITRAAASDATVLVEGDSGTGKERVARALHSRGARRAGPFVAVNCAAVPDALLETELFGHERGAFTGAVTTRIGRFEQAQGGTLFLDEVGELAAAGQAKLLRAIEEREIDRVGGSRPIQVDVRLVAATHRSLEAGIHEGSFREDLYYRLNVLRIRMPSLAERPEDIIPLAEGFLAEFAGRVGRNVAGFSPEAARLLRTHDWPGNVRELRNAIEHAVVLGSGGEIEAHDLPEGLAREPVTDIVGRRPGRSLYQDAIRQTRRLLFEAAFARAEGDYKRAAAALGIHPRTIHRILRTLDLTHLLGGRRPD